MCRTSGRNLDPVLGLERRNMKKNGIYAEFFFTNPAQVWERRDRKQNGIYPEFVGRIPTQFWDWRGGARRRAGEGGEAEMGKERMRKKRMRKEGRQR